MLLVVHFSCFLMPKIEKFFGYLAVCQKVALILKLYPVISLINESPALLAIDLTFDPKVYWDLINTDGRSE